ncbi:hypothetical protein [Nonomuraea sp. NPDC050202]|jgi:hypothetical protein|uniref:hypothetical protein n=1 Tax=Nonomuraea sp. NPDC050202 TaxID=3155035 RepID=UPI0033E8E348
MNYLDPKRLNEARLECLKLAAECTLSGPTDVHADDIVKVARRFETYLVNGE